MLITGYDINGSKAVGSKKQCISVSETELLKIQNKTRR